MCTLTFAFSKIVNFRILFLAAIRAKEGTVAGIVAAVSATQGSPVTEFAVCAVGRTHALWPTLSHHTTLARRTRYSVA